MNKILLLLLITPLFTFAQVTPGRYKFKLATDNLCMELSNSNFLRVADDCRAGERNCGSQVWQIVNQRGKPGIFQILLVGKGKYLTWDDLVAGSSTLLFSLQTRYPVVKLKYQCFTITPNDKGSFQIQPAIEGAISNDFYLGANLAGGNNAIGIYKMTNGNIRNAWRLMPPITPLPPQGSPSVIVTPPSDNKLDVDIKTGADNLEMKPYQDNVELRVIIRNKPDVILLNANNGQSWPNNSLKRVTINLPPDIAVNDLREIQIHRPRKQGPTTTIFSIPEKDNWNVNKISATAKIKIDGVMKTYKLADLISPSGSTYPLFRFVYEGGDGRTEGQVFKGGLSYMSPDIYPRTAAANPIIKIETLTGGDDLRGGNDNLNILIRLKVRPIRNIAINNINNRENWGNFTEHTVTKTITASPFTFNDIEDIVLKHTGGRGTGADDWHLDKLKITLTIGGETKVLVDEVAAPIHYFSGDSRSKVFPVNQ